MPSVTYVNHSGDSQTIDVPDGENIMRGALYNGIDGIIGECGGGLACATCHCYVDEAWAEQVGTPTSPEERDMLQSTAAEVRPTSRLSCQIVMNAELDGLVVHLPEHQF
ncbi:MAG TPA: 2Fe-2S iron-sulfur cluster-binding protein [Sphingobium sp.]|nr:2Fe-2S iron-sulfur cluster-binding protein [Sphingobium sp.]